MGRVGLRGCWRGNAHRCSRGGSGSSTESVSTVAAHVGGMATTESPLIYPDGLSPEFTSARDAYSHAAAQFHFAFIAEVERLIPTGVAAVLFSINDTPRMTFAGFRLADGSERDPEEIDELRPGLHDTLDMLAAEQGFTDPEAADSYLLGDELDDERWVITTVTAHVSDS